MVASAAVNSESSRPDLTPAPGSAMISALNPLNFFTYQTKRGRAARMVRFANGNLQAIPPRRLEFLVPYLNFCYEEASSRGRRWQFRSRY